MWSQHGSVLLYLGPLVPVADLSRRRVTLCSGSQYMCNGAGVGEDGVVEWSDKDQVNR